MRHRKLSPARVIATTATACGLYLAGLSGATAQLAVKEDNQWRYSLGVGGSVASGNSSTKSLNVNADAVKASAKEKWTLYGRLLYGEDNEETTSDQISTGVRYDRNLSANWFHFGTLDWLRDRPANLNQRWSINSGFGYHIFKEEFQYWDVLAGLGYSYDELADPSVVSDRLRSNYGRAELLLGEQSHHQLTPSTSLKQRLSIFPNLEDSKQYRGVFDTTLAVAMNSRFSLTASLNYRYNSDPGSDLEKRDLLFITGISVKME